MRTACHRVSVRVSVAALAMLAVLGLVLPSGAAAAQPTAPGADIRARLERLPGVTVVAEEKAPEGFRLFSLTLTQPADHGNPEAGTFEQRLSLLHRNVAAPMVLSGSGYSLSPAANRAEPTRIVNGNQISFEHRYFAPSVPEKPNRAQQLTIWQAATDQHRIATVFKRIYDANWLATGASKGGSVATYFRRFYPADVNGTIPYVAPNDVDNSTDAYNDFLDAVGTPVCRAKLQAARRDALQRRGEMLRLVRRDAAKDKLTFNTVGSAEHALEVSVVDSVFAFWQYRGQRDCKAIPKPGAEAAALYKFLVDTASPLNNSDQLLAPYVPYYFQASYQMGWPLPYERGIGDLLKYPGFNQAPSFVPESIQVPSFDDSAMADIDSWVRTDAERIMLVNGERDPWRAEPFELGPGSRDSYSFVVPRGNHGSQIEQLPPKQAAKATATVRRWAGLAPKPTPAGRAVRGAPPSFDANLTTLHRPPL